MDRFLKYKLSNGRGPDAQFSQPTTFGHGPDEGGWYYGHVNHTGDLPDLNAWQAVELTAEQVKAAGYGFLNPVEAKIDALWNAATDYQERFIRAIDLLGYQRKQTGGGTVTRALENVAWVDGIWADYYQRKSVIESGGDVSRDFSGHGEPPWSYLECMEE